MPLILPRSNRKTKRPYSQLLYRTRNIVERFFSCIKDFRRVAHSLRQARRELPSLHLAYLVRGCVLIRLYQVELRLTAVTLGTFTAPRRRRRLVEQSAVCPAASISLGIIAGKVVSDQSFLGAFINVP
jgi:hypothetical protein